jgi:hypothetical protein
LLASKNESGALIEIGGNINLPTAENISLLCHIFSNGNEKRY